MGPGGTLPSGLTHSVSHGSGGGSPCAVPDPFCEPAVGTIIGRRTMLAAIGTTAWAPADAAVDPAGGAPSSASRSRTSWTRAEWS